MTARRREGGISLFLEKTFDYAALNILYLAVSLPLITAGAASSALYYTAVKVLRMERGRGVVREFLSSFKLNFFKASALWIVFVFLIAAAAINRNIAPGINDGNFGLFLICLYTALGIFVSAVCVYSFAALSRFDMGILWIVKLALYMSVRYFHLTLCIAALLTAVFVCVYYMPLLIFFMPAGTALGLSFFIEKALIRHTPKNAASNVDAWYLEI